MQTTALSQTPSSLGQLVALAASMRVVAVPSSLRRLITPASQVLRAQVVARMEQGCHVRLAGQHDTMLPADVVPSGYDDFTVRLRHDGLAIMPAA